MCQCSRLSDNKEWNTSATSPWTILIKEYCILVLWLSLLPTGGHHYCTSTIFRPPLIYLLGQKIVYLDRGETHGICQDKRGKGYLSKKNQRECQGNRRDMFKKTSRYVKIRELFIPHLYTRS
jgi:hypothetical protein